MTPLQYVQWNPVESADWMSVAAFCTTGSNDYRSKSLIIPDCRINLLHILQ
jgi:hypothetical protein